MLKLPRRLAIAGILVGMGLMVFWECDYKYNFFHLPTAEEASRLQSSYTAPPAYRFLEKATFVLCPGVFLGFVTMDMGEVANLIMWLVTTVINGAVYYCVGLFLRAVGRRWVSG